MKFLTLLFSLLLTAAVAHAQQKIRIIKIDELEKLISEKSPENSMLVINFWATWCAPCVKELPLLEEFQAENKTAKVVLISLDYADKVDKVNSFISRKKIQSEVLLLDEIDGNTWIDKIDPTWGGAIPATLFIDQKTGRRKFVEKELHEGELDEIIEALK